MSPAQGRTRLQGVGQIVRFNARFYIGALIGFGIVLASAAWITGFWRAVLLLALLPGLFWLCSSLLVSYYVYDRFPLYRLEWLADHLLRPPCRWINLHAGLDETSHLLASRFPTSAGQALDFYDEAEMSEPSIKVARRLAHASFPARKADWRVLPVEDGTYDTAFLFFAAHELRTAAARAKLFAEVARVLQPCGELVLVEHLRDWPNFLAFGPGFLHFFPARAWRNAAGAARLQLREQVPLTPFVRAYFFQKPVRACISVCGSRVHY